MVPEGSFRSSALKQCDQNFNTLLNLLFPWQFFESFCSIWPNIEPTLAIFCQNGQIFIVLNGQILKTYPSGHTVLNWKAWNNYFISTSQIATAGALWRTTSTASSAPSARGSTASRARLVVGTLGTKCWRNGFESRQSKKKVIAIWQTNYVVCE